MDFFGVGRVEELLVVLVLMLILFGPDRLPEMAARLARFMRTFQRFSSEITGQFNETMRELEREYNETRGDWKAVGQGLDETMISVSKDLRTAADGEENAGAQEPGASVEASPAKAPSR